MKCNLKAIKKKNKQKNCHKIEYKYHSSFYLKLYAGWVTVRVKYNFTIDLLILLIQFNKNNFRQHLRL